MIPPSYLFPSPSALSGSPRRTAQTSPMLAMISGGLLTAFLMLGVAV